MDSKFNPTFSFSFQKRKIIFSVKNFIPVSSRTLIWPQNSSLRMFWYRDLNSSHFFPRFGALEHEANRTRDISATFIGSRKKFCKHKRMSVCPARKRKASVLPVSYRLNGFNRWSRWKMAPLQISCQNMVRTWYIWTIFKSVVNGFINSSDQSNAVWAIVTQMCLRHTPHRCRRRYSQTFRTQLSTNCLVNQLLDRHWKSCINTRGKNWMFSPSKFNIRIWSRQKNKYSFTVYRRIPSARRDPSTSSTPITTGTTNFGFPAKLAVVGEEKVNGALKIQHFCEKSVCRHWRTFSSTRSEEPAKSTGGNVGYDGNVIEPMGSLRIPYIFIEGWIVTACHLSILITFFQNSVLTQLRIINWINLKFEIKKIKKNKKIKK